MKPDNTNWILVGDVKMIPEYEGKRVTAGPHQIALFNVGEEYKAIENRCPHKQGPLADGIVAGNAVACPLHNLEIGLDSGCALNGGEGQVKTYPVKVQDGNIYIAIGE